MERDQQSVAYLCLRSQRISYNTNVTQSLSSSPGAYSIPNLDEDSSRLTMFASERVLSREWNTAEEDEAWAHL